MQLDGSVEFGTPDGIPSINIYNELISKWTVEAIASYRHSKEHYGGDCLLCVLQSNGMDNKADKS